MIITNDLYGIKHPKIHIKVNNDNKIDKVSIYTNDIPYNYTVDEVTINNNMLEIMITFPISTKKIKVKRSE